MDISIIDNPSKNKWRALCKRPAMSTSHLEATIKDIFDKVDTGGDQALRDYTSKFDKVELSEIEVSNQELKRLASAVSEELKAAMEVAKDNIYTFHAAQKLEIQKIKTSQGVSCWQEARAIERVGLYIPGGTAPLFSTILMLAIPAKIAGCGEVILCTPPNAQGKIHPAIAYAALATGIDKVYRIGGAQAIAAMSIGSESIPSVYKIFGPGNQYVTAAKQYAIGKGIAIDMPAGPSELLVIASDNSNPNFVAADLLSQAEHGEDSQVICLATSLDRLKKIIEATASQIDLLPRKEIAKIALSNSRFICLDNKEEVMSFTNQYGPEHLIIADDEYESYVSEIVNAGSVFLGNYCPESAGDYASGTNHTLPTSAFAKAYSGVNLDSFVKKITFQHITPIGIQNLGRTIEVLAENEGLFAHKNAVTLRLNELKSS